MKRLEVVPFFSFPFLFNEHLKITIPALPIPLSISSQIRSQTAEIESGSRCYYRF